MKIFYLTTSFIKKITSNTKKTLKTVYVLCKYTIYKNPNIDEEIINFIQGKKIAIVGNSKSIFDCSYGAEIESADVIVRMNRGFIGKPVSQGLRTDILALCCPLSEEKIITQFNPSYVMWMTPKRIKMNPYSKTLIKKLYLYPKTTWKREFKNIIGKTRPSCGLMIVSWIVKLLDARDISLYGFDFGKTKTFYNKDYYITPHNFDKEKRILIEYQKQGRLNIKL